MFVTGAQPVIATRSAKANAVQPISAASSAVPSQNIGPRARPKASAKANRASRLKTHDIRNGSDSL
jgi:hypothetical protein